MLFVRNRFRFRRSQGVAVPVFHQFVPATFFVFSEGAWAALSPQRLHPDHRHSTNTLLVMDAGLGFTRVSSRSRPSYPMPPVHPENDYVD